MQEATAHGKNIRIAPRKVQLVIDLIRGKAVGEAIAILRHTPRSASPIIEKILNSAIANAEHNFSIGPKQISDQYNICRSRTNHQKIPSTCHGSCE